MPALADLDDLAAVAPFTDSARAARLLEIASAVVERWCGRRFARVVADSRVVTVSDGTMWLPDGPVETVTSITGLVPISATVAPAAYAVSASGEVPRTYGWWPCGTYTVVYTHGYATIPDDIIYAVCTMASRMLSGPAAGVRSETIADYSVSYGGEQVGSAAGPLGAAETALLAPYRRSVGSVRVTTG